MAFINIKFMSEVLGRQSDINVIVPQKRTQGQIGIENKAEGNEYKTLLLLHGLSDNNTIWQRFTSIERYAIEKGIAVIMPSADRSFYTDMKYGDNYFTYISEEVLAVARQFLPLSEKREDNYVAGLSMGGYGALKIGLKKPDKFIAAAGLSSVADVEKFLSEHSTNLKYPIFGDGPIPASENLFCLAEECNKSEIKPRIYMGEGLQDFMYEDNIRLKEKFESLDFDFTYRESKGDHCWKFWDEYIQYVLEWMFD